MRKQGMLSPWWSTGQISVKWNGVKTVQNAKLKGLWSMTLSPESPELCHRSQCWVVQNLYQWPGWWDWMHPQQVCRWLKSTYRVADRADGCAAIQKDLKRLSKWANRNLMKFRGKCQVLPLGRNNAVHQYWLWTAWLESSLAEKHLMDMSQQCTLAGKGSQQHLGLH